MTQNWDTDKTEFDDEWPARYAKWTRGHIDIKRAVSNNNRVFFRYYADGSLWFITEFDELFPVPVSDLGTATVRLNEKALLFMRYMRKWNASLKEEHAATIAAMGGDVDIAGGPDGD